MSTSSEGDSHALPGDEVTRRLDELGIHGSDMLRLERAARMFERLEWRLAREQAAGTDPLAED